MSLRIAVRLGGKRRTLDPHVPLVLEGPAMVRVVESGAVAVSCARIEDGVQEGPRRFLFRCGAGHILLSLPASASRRFGLLAVPITDVAVAEVTLEAVGRAIADGEEEAAGLVDAWVQALGRVLADAPAPGTSKAVVAGDALVLEAGQAFRVAGEAVAWLEVEAGSARIMGRDDSPVAAGHDLLPLAPGTWVEAIESLRVRTRRSVEVTDPAVLESGLVRLQAEALSTLERRLAETEEEERRRLAQRHDIGAARAAVAMQELVGVLDPHAPVAAEGDALLAAMRTVGQAMGAEIRTPPRRLAWDGRADAVDVIARASHVRFRRVHLTGKWWKRDSGPILGWRVLGDEQRPVALLQRGSQQYVMEDPVDGDRVRVTDAVASEIAAQAVVLYAPLPEGKIGMRTLLGFSLRGSARELIFLAVTGVLTTLLGMVTPLATALLMDRAIPDADERVLMELGLALLAAAFGRALFSLAQAFISTRFGVLSEAWGQAGLWDRLLTLRPSFFRRFSSGDLQSRAMAVSEIGSALSGAALTAAFGGILALLNLVLLFWYSSRLAWIASLIVLVVFLVSIVFGYFIRRKVRVLQDLRGRLYGFVVQLVQGVSKLRVAGAESPAFTQWAKRYATQMRLTLGAQRLEDAVGVFNNAVPLLSTLLLLWFGFSELAGTRVQSGESPLSLGHFLAFYSAFGTFLGGATTLSNTLVGLLDTFAKGRRVRPIFEAKPEVDREMADPGTLTGHVALEQAVFGYRADGPKVLDHVDLSAEPGEFVAIVGPSGSGKSTLLRLLLGFETPQSGAVTYDGQDLSGLDVRAVRWQIGVVLQAGRLNAGSIFDNVAAGVAISLDDAWEAVRAAGLGDEIAAMPMQLQTIVSEGGGNLSGGQRQRILIARALVRRPRILLFDEATSALDNASQAIVGESLARRRVTRIVVAHRLSTIRDADRIYVLDEGRVVEQGRFEDLVSADGFFARMMARQMA